MVRRPGWQPDGRSVIRNLSLPSPGPAFSIEDLSDHPSPFCAHQPGNETGRIIGFAKSSGREVSQDLLSMMSRKKDIWLTGVNRPGIDHVESDSRLNQIVSDRRRYAGKSSLQHGVSDLVSHRSLTLTGG
jgi:hypothetical protein